MDGCYSIYDVLRWSIVSGAGVCVAIIWFLNPRKQD